MNSKPIMTLSAVVLAIIGLSLTFLPGELAVYMGAEYSKSIQIIFQILGALYFAFAMLNWMAKGATIGGIYNRPIAIANFAHFMIGGLALIKVMMSNAGLPNALWILTAFYLAFAFAFGLLLFRHPVSTNKA